MGDVKKPELTYVMVRRIDSEFEQFQSLEQIGLMIGGVLGEALLDMLAPYRDDVIDRARS